MADLAHGETFGNLTVLGKIVSKERGARYVCGCACGAKKNYFKASQLKSGKATQCGRCKKGTTNG